jgi:hypothetical protein
MRLVLPFPQLKTDIRNCILCQINHSSVIFIQFLRLLPSAISVANGFIGSKRYETIIPNKNDDKSGFDVMEVNRILSITECDHFHLQMFF